MQFTAPCLLPDFSKIKTIKVVSPRYWPQILDIEGNSTHARLLKRRVIYVKRRIGFLSYLEDPKNYRSILSRSLSTMKHNYNPFNVLDSTNDTYTPSSHQRNESDAIGSFSTDSRILAFAQQFCGDEIESSSFFTTVLNECLTQEKPEMLQYYLQLFQFAKQIQSNFFLVDNQTIWNIKLLIDYYTSSDTLRGHSIEPLVEQSFLESLRTRLERFFISESGIDSLRINNYLQTGLFPVNPNLSKSPMVQRSTFGNYLTYFGVPSFSKLLQLATKLSVPENLLLPALAKLNFVNILKSKNTESQEELVKVLHALKIRK